MSRFVLDASTVLTCLPVTIDDQATPGIVFNTTQTLCRKHGLTAYDAAYLELAQRDQYVLATTDNDLRRAAIAEGVQVF